MSGALTKREMAEMYRLMRRVHHLKATRREQNRYMVLSRQHEAHLREQRRQA